VEDRSVARTRFAVAVRGDVVCRTYFRSSHSDNSNLALFPSYNLARNNNKKSKSEPSFSFSLADVSGVR